jgi:RND family efflux transporter MFP subunit
MFLSKPITALAASGLMLATVAAVAQSGGSAQGPGNTDSQVLVLEELARIDWVETSKVACLREGVIAKMELQIGMPVKQNGVIGVLHSEIADLTVRKNQLQADSIAPQEKAKAQKDVAISVVARNQNLNGRKPGMVSDEDVAKAIGELNVAEAQFHEAVENQAIATAELKLAQRILEEHTIRAPFDGVVLKRMRNPGESVRANDAVVELGNINKLCAESYVPLSYAYRVKEGQVVEIQPRLKLGRGEPLAIEKKRYRGKITFIHPTIQPVAETAVRIRAEFENPGDLRPGLMVQMTIFLTPDVAAEGAQAPGPTRTAGAP